MVDREVMIETKKILSDQFSNQAEMIDYIFKGRILDVNKCRIAIIKRYHRKLVESGIPANRARELTAEKFHRSENTVRNMVYDVFYKEIFI